VLLATDFPTIPEEQRRDVAQALLPACEPVFSAYRPGDDFAARPEFRQLKEELRQSIRTWLDDNGAPGYEAKLRHPQRQTSLHRRSRN
jgi:hypothetical protein